MRDFRGQAACRDHDPELWFPMPADKSTERKARAVCWGCPVVAECLEWALDKAVSDGIWGGQTEDEREVELRARRPPDRPRVYRPEQVRKCTACQQTKPVDNFGTDRSRPDGLASRCKPCKSVAVRDGQRQSRARRWVGATR